MTSAGLLGAIKAKMCRGFRGPGLSGGGPGGSRGGPGGVQVLGGKTARKRSGTVSLAYWSATSRILCRRFQ